MKIKTYSYNHTEYYKIICNLMEARKSNIREPCTLVFQNNPEQINQGCLYLGGVSELQNKKIYQLGIGAIVTLLPKDQGILAQMVELYAINQIQASLWIPISDSPLQTMLPYLKETHDFITSNLANTNVFVHCKQGISRSSAIIISYYMKILKKSLSQAYGLLSSKRSIINPNQGFMDELQKYNKMLIIESFYFNGRFNNKGHHFWDTQVCKEIHYFIDPGLQDQGNIFIGNAYSYRENIRNYFSIGLSIELHTLQDGNKNLGNQISFKIYQGSSLIESAKCLDSEFDKLIKYIETNIKATNILLWCSDGIKTSPLICAAYLSIKQNTSLNTIISYIKHKHPLTLILQSSKSAIEAILHNHQNSQTQLE